jgi:hypothetical protein
MKKNLLCFFACLFFTVCFASAESSVNTISTKYFDIIYTERSAESARLLAEYADGFADDICARLGSSMGKRIPVYIEPANENLNAYFTPSRYDHIVLYDTVPEEGSLAVFHNSLLMVFYHELTHAVSLSIRTPFWQAMSAVFGDILSVNNLVTMPLSFVEGVTVSFESASGEGRLNDPLTDEYFAQDRLEGKFPSWKEAAGARDIYPGGKIPYLYGGAFSAWLQKTYGMEKYAELWRRGGGLNIFRSEIEGRFSQVYGLSLDSAWTAFRDSIPVPVDVTENPNRLSGTGDGVYSSLTAGPTGLVWYDGNSGEVRFRSTDGRVRTLFSGDATFDRLSLSPDGTLLLVSCTAISARAVTRIVRLYDLKHFRFTGEVWSGLRDASFAGSNDRICAVECAAQKSSLVVVTRRKPDETRTLFTAGPGQPFYSVFNPVYAGNGNLAFIGANGLDRALVLVDIDGADAAGIVALPDGVGYIRYLQTAPSASGPVLSFSWTDRKGFYRFALVDTAAHTIALQARDYSGGTFFPVYDEASDSVRYVAACSGRNALLSLPASESTVLPFELAITKALPQPGSFAIPASDTVTAKPYNPFPWFLDGQFIPLITLLPVNNALDSLAPGFVYFTGDPTETVSLAGQAFFSVAPFYADWAVDAGFSTGLGPVDICLEDHLMSKVSAFAPYRDVAGTLSLSVPVTPGVSWKTVSLSLSGTAHAYAPGVSVIDNPYAAQFTSASLSASPTIAFSAYEERALPQFPLFAVTKTGPQAILNGYCGMVFPDQAVATSAQAKLQWYTPLVPLTLSVSGAASDGLAFSPSSVYSQAKCAREIRSSLVRYVPAFPEYADTSYDNISASLAAGGIAELTVMTLEIQRGLPILPLYANRLVLAGGYRGAVFDDAAKGPVYVDSAYARLTAHGAITTGILSRVVLEGNLQLAVPLRAGEPLFTATWGLKAEQ